MPSGSRLLALLVVLAALLGACGGGDVEVREPVSGRDGIQATGRLEGRPVAISRGAPIVIIGDCDPGDGPDEDLCIEARTIDGLTVLLVIENRDALVAGETVPVGRATCTDGCDSRRDEVIARVELPELTREVTGGSLEVTADGPRYTADFDLTLSGNDRLRGSFDVVENLPVDNPDGVLRPAESDGEVAPGS